MAEVDVSSYKLPVQKSPIEAAITMGEAQHRAALMPGQLTQQQQGIESSGLTIDKQKLDLVNQRFGQMAKGFTALINDPKLDDAAVNKFIDNQVQLGYIDPHMASVTKSQLPKDPKQLRQHLETQLAHAQTITEAINFQYGQPTMVGNGQQTTPSVVSPRFGVKPIGNPIQTQLPVDTDVTTPTGNRKLGAQPAQVSPGMVPQPGGLPGQGMLPVAPMALPVGPVTGPALQGPSANFGGNVISANVEPPASVEQRIDASYGVPRGPATSQPPMFEQGKADYAKDQALSTDRMTAVKPAIQALKMMDGLRSGPGTEPFNKAVAFLKANNIITTAEENDPTAIYQEVTKKLAGYVGGSSLANRSDAGQALAEAGSPSPKTQIAPALKKLTLDAIILDRVQAARANAFEGNDFANYGKHRSNFPQSIDEKAFGLDLMPPEESKALVDKMHSKYKKNPKDAEALKFFKSLDIAKKQGFFENANSEEAPIGKRSDAGTNQVVMSDADPELIKAGQQYAQTVMRPLGNGQVQVINPRTGQVLYTGSAAGAANSQANNGGMRRIVE